MDEWVIQGERFYREPDRPRPPGGTSITRSDADRDFGRVLHSGAFRRLQGKSQVVHTGHADYFRTRLTHTLEVSQIARALARNTGKADPSLVEVAALIHDLGHPPFGHNGENILKTWMDGFGGFEGNAQSFRIVSMLEVKFPPGDTGGTNIGLNLSRETLRASMKYPWPSSDSRAKRGKFGYYEDDPLEAKIARWVLRDEVPDKTDAARIVDLADDIAYSVHDLEDGVRARLIPLHGLKTALTERRALVDYWVGHEHSGDSDAQSRLSEALDRLLFDSGLCVWADDPYRRTNDQRGAIKMMTSGLIDRFVQEIGDGRHGLSFPDNIQDEVSILKGMTWHYVIDSQELQTLRYRERKIIEDLANTLFATGSENLLPAEQARRMRDTSDERERARIVCDFVAGMTDRFAQTFHARLFGAEPQAVTDLL